jgi:hypothetical protein
MADFRRRPSIFINCPFDPEFQPFLRATLFTICAMECKPRSALEESDSSILRLEKIYTLIEKCRFSIHDLSRTELSASTGLPRFNMPLELGIFLGIKRSTSSTSRKKTCLIFVKDKHNVSFITDLNGVDVEAHGNNPEKVIRPIRNWLCEDAKIRGRPASIIEEHFKKFEEAFPTILKEIGFEPDEPQYGDILKIAAKWLEANPAQVFVSVSGKVAISAPADVRHAISDNALTVSERIRAESAFDGPGR